MFLCIWRNCLILIKVFFFLHPLLKKHGMFGIPCCHSRFLFYNIYEISALHIENTFENKCHQIWRMLLVGLLVYIGSTVHLIFTVLFKSEKKWNLGKKSPTVVCFKSIDNFRIKYLSLKVRQPVEWKFYILF